MWLPNLTRWLIYPEKERDLTIAVVMQYCVTILIRDGARHLSRLMQGAYPLMSLKGFDVGASFFFLKGCDLQEPEKERSFQTTFQTSLPET